MEISFELRTPPGYDKPVEYVRATVDAHEIHRAATEFDRVAFRVAYAAFLKVQPEGYKPPEPVKQAYDVTSSAMPAPEPPKAAAPPTAVLEMASATPPPAMPAPEALPDATADAEPVGTTFFGKKKK